MLSPFYQQRNGKMWLKKSVKIRLSDANPALNMPFVN